MNDKNLPPQAYTRELFAQAYEWLKIQSPQVQEMAKSPDDIVGLYLQARRHRQVNKTHFANAETPVSAKNFRSELKHLAEDLKSFESVPTAPAARTQVLQSQEIPPPAFSLPEQLKDVEFTTVSEANMPIEGPIEALAELDERSRQMLAEIQQRFNLGSEVETLRLTIVMGYERILEYFPN